MYQRTCLFSMSMVALVAFTLNLYGRGEVPPPPQNFDGGNAGDWLGSGPIFGFRHPWGIDLPGDGHGSFDPGDNGYGWGGGGNNSGGRDFDPGPNSCSCGPVNLCNRLNVAKCEAKRTDYCEAWCSCSIKLGHPRPRVGTVINGTCILSGSPKSSFNRNCSAPGGGCGIKYGVSTTW